LRCALNCLLSDGTAAGRDGRNRHELFLVPGMTAWPALLKTERGKY
jgi:hypothetical protein